MWSYGSLQGKATYSKLLDMAFAVSLLLLTVVILYRQISTLLPSWKVSGVNLNKTPMTFNIKRQNLLPSGLPPAQHCT